MSISANYAKMIQGLVGEAKDMAEFFNGMPDRVALVNRMIYMRALKQEGVAPEWLRGCLHISDLPRFRKYAVGHRFNTSGLSFSLLAERVAWIVENQNGPWGVTLHNLVLPDDRDAVHYKLRFG